MPGRERETSNRERQGGRASQTQPLCPVSVQRTLCINKPARNWSGDTVTGSDMRRSRRRLTGKAVEDVAPAAAGGGGGVPYCCIRRRRLTGEAAEDVAPAAAGGGVLQTRQRRMWLLLLLKEEVVPTAASGGEGVL